ncbi:MAG: F0F1 ATP synthase subunit epsilon [Alphaproteobacteria bacterium]|nr:F0F1 ATP synthase subunit epsilon [Alphaproteobacteria bacterium]
MATFQFELVSPEKLLFSGEVTQVDVPGEEGEFGVFAGHAPYIATLKPGVLTVYRDSGPVRVVVRGGFAEVGPNGLTVLAEQAALVDELDPNALAAAVRDAEEDLADAKDDAARDKARERLEQLQTLRAALTRSRWTKAPADVVPAASGVRITRSPSGGIPRPRAHKPAA